MRSSKIEKKSKLFLNNINKNINKMSDGIQKFITVDDYPELDTWLSYISELKGPPDDLDENELIPSAVKIKLLKKILIYF